jgi:hypothetical protein
VTDAADAVGADVSTKRATGNVYRDTESLLRDVGWTQGRERSRGGKLSLTGAVRTTVCSDATTQVEQRVVRIAKMRRHLREIARTSSLLAWNDAPERRFDDVVHLLRVAAERFPSD